MTRVQIMTMLTQHIKDGIFVELGTDGGAFSEEILAANPTCTLYCIDPYTSYQDYNDSINQKTGDHLYKETKKRLTSLFGERVKFIRQFSDQVDLNSLPDFDYVYIDANHAFKYVLSDLKRYFPKLKPGRVCQLDDVCDTSGSRDINGNIHVKWGPNCEGQYGVFHALNTFCTKKSLFFTMAPAVNQAFITKL